MNLQQRRLVTRRFMREAQEACLRDDLGPVALVYARDAGEEDVEFSFFGNAAFTTDAKTMAQAIGRALARLIGDDGPEDGPDSFDGIPIGADGGPLAAEASPPRKSPRQAVLHKSASAGCILVDGGAVHTMACPYCGRRVTLGFGSPAADVVPAEDADLYAVCYPCRKAIGLFRSMPPPYSPWPKRELWQEAGAGI